MPAAEVGLKKGDIILSIDDEDMTNKEVSYVSDHLRGEPGSSFMLKVKRPSTGKILKVKVTRRTIQMPFLPYYGMMEGGIGYINFNSFTDNCAKDVRRAFIDLKKQGAKGLVFDLRSNGGVSASVVVVANASADETTVSSPPASSIICVSDARYRWCKFQPCLHRACR